MSSPSLIRSESFTVPRVRLPFSAQAVRPDGEVLRAHAIRWGEEHGLLGPRGGTRLARTSLLGLGVALTGTAPPTGAAVLMDWFLWAVVLDDRVDDGPWAEDGALDRFTAVVEAITRGQEDQAGVRDPMLTALAEDLWPRTARLADEVGLERLRGHLLQHLDAQRALVRMRGTAAGIRADDYVRLRRHTFGALLFFDLIEAADGLVLPADPCGRGCWQALRDRAADIVSWTNDIHSVAKDMVLGERFNLVTVVAQERGLNLQAAVDAVHEMLATVVNGFTAVKRRHLRHDDLWESDRLDRSRAADRLEQVMRACVDWHRATSRYHLQAGIPEHDSHKPVHTGEATPTLKSRQFEIDPYPLYERLRTTCPVVYDEPTDTWLLSRHADVRTALPTGGSPTPTTPGRSPHSWATASCPWMAASTLHTGLCSPRSSAAGHWPSCTTPSLRSPPRWSRGSAAALTSSPRSPPPCPFA